MMRIAFVLTRTDPIGGAQIHVRDLSDFLADKGHEVIVLTGSEADAPNAFTEALKRRQIPTVPVRNLAQAIHPARDLVAFFQLRSILAKLDVDLVSTHSSKAGFLGRLAAKSLGLPVLFTAHGWAFAEGVPPKRALVYRQVEKIAAHFADSIITVSEADRQLALRHHIASANNLHTIHNGMPELSPQQVAIQDVKTAALIMVARFQEQKDHSTLLHALSGVVHQSWVLKLIGEGPLRPRAMELAERLGIGDRVYFLGERTDVANLLAQAQVFLLITHWEGFPRSILEAMRAGLPVIASDVGGCRESVVDGVTGFLVPRRDIETLRDKLQLLIATPQLRKEMGTAGRERFEHNFTFGRMADQTLAIYESILAQKPS